jgi:hypothetical protein
MCSKTATVWCSFWTAAVLAGCGFSPRIPDGTIVCNRDSDCPAGLSCTPGTDGTAALCCRGGTCPARINGPSGGSPGALDGGPPGSSPAADAGPDAPAGPAPAPSPPDDAASPPDLPADAADPAALVRCTPGLADLPPPAGNRRLTCTIFVGNATSSLGVDSLIGNDPVSTAAQGGCQAPLALGELDGPVPPATVEALVAVLQRFQQACSEARGTLVGAVAASWARAAPNRAAVAARVLAATQIELAVPDEDEELEHRYRGAARNRIGRIVLDDGGGAPQILVWPAGDSAPTRHLIPLSFQEAGAMYLTAATYAGFEPARLALRMRLQNALQPVLDELAELLDDEEVLPEIAIGPGTDPTVPLAVEGDLRDPQTGWFDLPRYQAAIAMARPTASPYGQALGILTPSDLDRFFPSLGERDFVQLRSEALRAAYGERILLTTVLLDIFGDEVLATEFGFPATAPHLGFLLRELFPEIGE